VFGDVWRPKNLGPEIAEASAYTKDCDAFCVVRDPVTRFLSHWRCHGSGIEAVGCMPGWLSCPYCQLN